MTTELEQHIAVVVEAEGIHDRLLGQMATGIGAQGIFGVVGFMVRRVRQGS